MMGLITKSNRLHIAVAAVAVAAIGLWLALGDRGQRGGETTVVFHAWGGSPAINDYIQWAADEMRERHGITIEHVKVTDPADTVSRILAEKTAGRDEGGSVDLTWVNGENFASLKRNGLLRDDAWAFELPSFALTDPEALPALVNDFANPTDGLESPWGRAQLVFGHDTAELASPPRSVDALKDWITANPGRFTFPQPPDFVGSTFLKQVLLEITDTPERLAVPADPAVVDATLAPLWEWLEETTPHLWRGGRSYPANYTEMVQLLGDREIDIAMAFNPAEFSNNITGGVLPDTVRTYIHEKGTIANVHFVAIPFNANAPEAAMRFAEFLLSPEAQARKANPDVWGDPTVLSMDKLSAEDRARFETLPRGIATLPDSELTPSLPEPHPTWMEIIEAGWLERFGSGS